ncbi:response regulator [Kiloniella sp. EL199]|uniref:ATP-binding response regulator n=1 Tax=Kiloniella sp. EL199 TaxID=2107581 RepID=UPI000EA07709|nr:response regulator [Kiloniella sp. EL199]
MNSTPETMNGNSFAAKILIVDDQIANVQLLEMILKKAGYTDITYLTDSRLVADLHQAHGFDLILLDIRMPHMDGFQVIEQLSMQIKNDYLPVAVLTAQQEDATRYRAYELGAKDCIVKPFDKKEVLHRIRNMLTVRMLHKQIKEQNAQLERRVQKRTQELIHSRDAAEAANKAKTAFLANMSHELRTPLNGIIGFSEIMEAQLFGNLGNDQYLEYTSDIKKAGLHLKDVIANVLDISRIESGNYNCDLSNVNLGEIISTCISMIKHRAEEQRITIDIDLVQENTCLVADKTLLKQTILNLISNSVKYTPADGEITIKAKQGTNSITIYVTDTGRGIAKEDMGKVLEPFGQARENAEIAHEGVGLGLFLAKSYTELQGGELTLQSELGAGTTISLRFPISTATNHQTQ